MRVIGIDPGTSCGWAVLDTRAGRVASGAWDLKPKRHEGGGMRYLRVRNYLRQLLAESPDALVYEEVRRHAGTTAAHVYGGIVATIQTLLEEHGIPYMAIPVGTIKKHATGNGSASKAAMISAANERWHTRVSTDDEADALWCAQTWIDDQELSHV